MLQIDNSGKARITVFLPAYNEEKNIRATMKSLLRQDFHEPVELMVIDNNSKDKTAEIAREFGAKVIKEKNKGTRFAYDRGFKEANGEIVVVTNADVLMEKNWLQIIVDEYQDPNVVGVGTHVKFHNCPAYINSYFKMSHFVHKTVLRMGFNKGIKTFWGASMSSTKRIYNKVGFNHGTNTNEDMVYTNLIAKYGKTVYTYKTIASLDGRRYANGPFSALKNLLSGIGGNAFLIGLGFGSKIKDFEDIRS